MSVRDKGKYKPCSFYVPEKDMELMRFMAAQSNMSLSMRLLMKAFLASNRHETDIDVSMMDLSDLVRSMRVDPELFEDVPKRMRQPRSISAVEGEEIRAQERAAAERRAALGEAPAPEARSEPGFGYRQQAQDPVREARPEPVSGYRQQAPVPEAAPEPAYRPQVPEPVPQERQPAYEPQPAPVREPAGHAQPSGQGQDDDLDPMSMMGDGM